MILKNLYIRIQSINAANTIRPRDPVGVGVGT